MPAAAVTTLGCKVNQAEGESLAVQLAGAGFLLVAFDQVADVYVVNSCTVTAEADHKSRKLARAALRTNPGAVVILAGCYATEAGHRNASLPERVELAPSSAKVTLAAGISARFGLPAEAGDKVEHPLREAARTRAMLKVQDGCDNGCSYCVVPLARGGPNSRPAAEVVAEAVRLVEADAQEIVLTGINLGRYLYDGLDLPALTRRILESGISRLRLSSIEPQDFSDELVELIGAEERICPHVHVPLQSGSDEVLWRMRRRYLAKDFISLAERLSVARPGIALTTDVIVGFPGETEADADSTLKLLEGIAPTKIHIFKYSPRPRTAAAQMPGQTDPQVKRARAARLADLDAELGARFARALVGSRLEVLVESVKDGRAAGLTPNYVRCFFKGDAGLKGTIVGITAMRAKGRALVGERDSAY